MTAEHEKKDGAPRDGASRDRPTARFHGRVESPGRLCSEPGCEQAGEFRAPLLQGVGSGHEGPRPYRWLCLDHVRAFNAGYNFFSGMSVDEIHDAQRPLAGWERETRAFTGTGGADRPPKWADFADPLNAIGARFTRRMDEARADGKLLSESERRALKVLGLGMEVDRRGLRQRYAELVRKYHPDRNGGDRSYEKALQEVIVAYTQLKSAAAFA